MPAEGPLRNGGDTGFHLIETMRREPGAGIVRRERHLARLEGSAQALGFAYDAEKIERALAKNEPAPELQRIRLLLARDGGITLETAHFVPLAPETVWSLRIAATRLESRDEFLRYKTSRRARYEKARAEFPASDANEVILLNERGEVCEGTITSIFAQRDDGVLLTPPLACGLLAGVLRAELIERGDAVESLLTPDDLDTAAEVFVGNSLRGLIRARMAGEVSP